MASSALKAYEAQYREDIAAQLRGLGVGHVTVSPERVELNLESIREGTLRILVGLNEDEAARPGWGDWLQLRIETEDRTTPLLTLAWCYADDGGRTAALAARISPDLPLEARGLNAAADIREGRSGRGDALKMLRAELEVAVGHSLPPMSQALIRIDALRRAGRAVSPVKAFGTDDDDVRSVAG